jgi:hypothetical protein
MRTFAESLSAVQSLVHSEREPTTNEVLELIHAYWEAKWRSQSQVTREDGTAIGVLLVCIMPGMPGNGSRAPTGARAQRSLRGCPISLTKISDRNRIGTSMSTGVRGWATATPTDSTDDRLQGNAVKPRGSVNLLTC